jgi:hypothetical protein
VYAALANEFNNAKPDSPPVRTATGLASSPLLHRAAASVGTTERELVARDGDGAGCWFHPFAARPSGRVFRMWRVVLRNPLIVIGLSLHLFGMRQHPRSHPEDTTMSSESEPAPSERPGDGPPLADRRQPGLCSAHGGTAWVGCEVTPPIRSGDNRQVRGPTIDQHGERSVRPSAPTQALTDTPDPRDVFLDAKAVMRRYGWGKTRGYQHLRDRDLIPPPVLRHPDRWRLDQLQRWEDRRIAEAEARGRDLRSSSAERLRTSLPSPKPSPRKTA